MISDLKTNEEVRNGQKELILNRNGLIIRYQSNSIPLIKNVFNYFTGV